MSRQEARRDEQAEQHIRHILEAGEARIREQIPSGKSSMDFDPAIRLFKETIARNERLSAGLGSERYQRFREEFGDFLGARGIIQTCGHGDIISARVAPPRVNLYHRKLGGEVSTRTTTFGFKEIADPVLTAAIDRDAQAYNEKGQKPRFIIYAGSHINTADPSNGCSELVSEGQMLDTMTRRLKVLRFAGHKFEIDESDTKKKKERVKSNGGLPTHFENLREGFSALTDYVADKKSESATISMVYDAGTGYIVYGGKGVYERKGESAFDESRSLRDNLIQLHQSGDILMTELLERKLGKQIAKTASEKGLKITRKTGDTDEFIGNIIKAGRIAQVVTQREERANGFDWMPNHIRQNEPDWAVRSVAAHAIYNIAIQGALDSTRNRTGLKYRKSGIIRIGPEGYAHDTYPQDIEVVAPGGLREKHLVTVGKLLVQKRQQIIFVTGNYDPKSPEVDPGEYRKITKKQVIDNAEAIGESLEGYIGVKPVIVPVFMNSHQSMEQIL